MALNTDIEEIKDRLNSEQPRGFAWAKDLMEAVEERPWYAKVLLRLALGKYAFNEFLGLRGVFSETSIFPVGYQLEDAYYHNEKHPFIWWADDTKH